MNERVTVSLPVELVTEARRAVETGDAASVSSYIADTEFP
jgi:Arc/MetJ-type ribon-helix-helix transcriptional regulator